MGISVAQAQMISTMTSSRDSIEIGESVDIIYKLTFRDLAKIQFVDYTVFDTLTPMMGMASMTGGEKESEADIDWNKSFSETGVKKIRLDRNKLKQTANGYEWIDTLNGTFWDMGYFLIDHPSIAGDSSTIVNMMKSEPVSLLVKPPEDVVNQDTTQMILPIKTIIAEPSTWEDYLWILYACLGLAILFGLIYFFFIKKNKAEEVIERVIIKKPAHTIALEKLRALRSEAYWTKGEVKKHQTELTYIIREYLENRFDIHALESTTDQISKSLKEKDFSSTHENDLKEILQIADLVKFAKAKPPVDINELFLDKAKNFVEETKDSNATEEHITIIEQKDGES